MKLTPLEVRKQTFRKTMRGFDVEEVRIFLDMVADEYEKILQENGMLSEKVRYLNERLEEYHGLEKTLQSSILTAERAGADSRERSRLEAQTIVSDAQVRAERILEDSRSRLRLLGEQIQQLGTQKDLFVQRFQSLLDAQAQFLQSHQEELQAIDEIDRRTGSLITDVSRDAAEPEAAPAEAGEAPVPEHVPFDGSEREEEPAEGDDPFFAPAERQEGFFELSANAEEGAQR